VVSLAIYYPSCALVLAGIEEAKDASTVTRIANNDRIGTDQMNGKDRDGKATVKEREELAKEQPSFWQSYKLMNPVTKEVESQQIHCERVDQTVVCLRLSVLRLAPGGDR
jgi:hypothetical protein